MRWLPAMRSLGVLVLAIAMVTVPAASGCDGEAQPSDAGESPSVSPTGHAAPADLLTLLDPLPFATLDVEYQIEGPAGLTGTMRWRAVDGGYRRSDWKLALANEQPPTTGGHVETPAHAWRWQQSDGTRPTFEQPVPRNWEALQAAFADSPPATRRAVAATVRKWQRAIATGASHATTVTVLGKPCRIVERPEGVRACLWHGVALRYELGGLTVTAHTLRTDADIDPMVFDLPDQLPLAIADPPEVPALLARLAAGDWADLPNLTLALQPGPP